MAVTCDCVPVPRQFGYDNSEPEIIDYDTRTSIPAQEYKNDMTISSFDLRVCKTIGNEAFYASSLEEIDLPECTTIGAGAFYNCVYLKDGSYINLPKIDTIGSYAFSTMTAESGQGNKHIYVDIGNVRRIEDHAFQRNTYLVLLPGREDLVLPKCEYIGQGIFFSPYSNYRRYFKNIDLPKIQENSTQFLLSEDTTNGNTIHFGPNCTQTCQIADLSDFSHTDIDKKTIKCNNVTVYFDAVTPPAVTDSYLFGSYIYYDPDTGHSEFGGRALPTHIYVPSGSVNAYKAASVWSIYASVIEANPNL